MANTQQQRTITLRGRHVLVSVEDAPQVTVMRPTCPCADAVNRKVDDGTFRQALSRSQTIPADVQDKLVGRASRKRYLRGRYVDDVRQVLERLNWPADEIDLLLYRSKHVHERQDAVPAVERVETETAAVVAVDGSEQPRPMKVARRRVAEHVAVEPRACIMLTNPGCGFASRHTIFCCAYDKSGDSWFACEENAEFHVHHSFSCGNECKRHAERSKSRGAYISAIEYVEKASAA